MSDMSMASNWIRTCLGKPWRADAGGPEAYDCKGLVRAVQLRVWGREVPALLHAAMVADWAAVRQACERQGWRPTDAEPAEGDILLVHGATGAHVGVFVRVSRRLQVLHAQGQVIGGRQVGRVRLNLLAELLQAGYTRPQVWRHQA